MSVYCCVAIAALGQQAIAATNSTSDGLLAYGQRVWNDSGHILTAPLRWDQEDVITIGAEAAIVVGTAVVVDTPIRKYVDEHATESSDSKAKFIQRFGEVYAFGVLGTFYLLGELTDNDNAVAVAEDGLESSIIAAGIITPTLKVITGRSRPSQNNGDFTFRLFGGDASFPSGHTTEAFAVASSIAGHYNDPFVDAMAYGVATCVGLARIEQRAHYASDVVAAAMIGTGVGRAVLHLNQAPHTGITYSPLLGPDVVGIGITLSL